eukprot:gene25950-11631_t
MMVGGDPAEAVRGTEWVAALWGIYLNFACSMLALFMGQQLGLTCLTLLHRPSGSASSAAAAKTNVGVTNNGAPASKLTEAHVAEKAVAKDPVAEKAVDPDSVAIELAEAKPASPSTSGGVTVIADICILAITLALTGLSIAYIVIYSTDESEAASSEDLGELWFGILFAPLGCITRWQLSKLNGTIGWFPLGTWAANIIATSTDFAMRALLLRLTLSSVVASLLDGIILGFGGCLSTVSTWMTEVQKQTLADPRGFMAFQYVASSVVAATAAGIVIYGSAVWTM